MRTLMRIVVGLVLALVPSIVCAQQSIRPSPSGPRILFVDGDDIRPEPGGKRLLFIDDDSLRPEPGGKRLLFIDGDNIRPDPQGIRLRCIDGENLRDDFGGKIMLNYHHPDICPTAHDNRIYFVDGDPLSRAQYIAVLYVLKPELFKLSDAEIAARTKAMQQAGAEQDALAKEDKVLGKWEILNSGGAEKIGSGFLQVGPKLGEAYFVKFAHKDGPDWEGIAVQRQVPMPYGDHWLWVAFGTPKTVGLVVYEITGGTLRGRWIPWDDSAEAKTMGLETLQGPENLDGQYTIVEANAPKTGAAYTGTVTIKPANVVGSAEQSTPYLVTWNVAGLTFTGIGIRNKNYLAVASGSGAEAAIGALKLETNNTMIGDWYAREPKERGWYTTMKSQ